METAKEVLVSSHSNVIGFLKYLDQGVMNGCVYAEEPENGYEVCYEFLNKCVLALSNLEDEKLRIEALNSYTDYCDFVEKFNKRREGNSCYN